MQQSKELSQITDEDAMEVAKIFHPDYEWSIERSEIVVSVECVDYIVWIWLNDNDFIDFEERYHGKENVEAHGGESELCSPYRTIIDIIDYLRYKGYNLPNGYQTTKIKDNEK